MPPRKQKIIIKKKKTVKSKGKGNLEINRLNKLISQMTIPKNEVTDLGRMLLHGGNMLGGLVGLPTIFGKGDYEMNQNTCFAKNQVPYMHSSSETVTLRHREYISDIVMNGPAFTNYPYPVNPGQAGTFPFLSAIAQNFQEYSFKGLVFEYKSTSATAIVAGTNTAMGSVAMAMQYRADAPVFVNKLSLLNEMWSVDSPPSGDSLLPVECAPLENPFAIQYIRTGPATGDIKNFDLGVFNISTSGGQAGQLNVIGELWVTYEVELRKPQLTSIFSNLSDGYVILSSGYSNANPLLGSIVTYSDPPGTLSTTPNTIIMVNNQGTFWVHVHWKGVLTVSFTPGITATNSTITPVAADSGNAATDVFAEFVWTVPNGQLSATLTFGAGTLPPAGQLIVSIMQVDPVFSTILP